MLFFSMFGYVMIDVGFFLVCFVFLGGTGWRHRVKEWPTSLLTGRKHKLVIPAVPPGNKV